MDGRYGLADKTFPKQQELISLKFFEVVAGPAAVAIFFIDFVDLLFIFPSEQL